MFINRFFLVTGRWSLVAGYKHLTRNTRQPETIIINNFVYYV